MGSRGPVPKRSNERAGHRTKAERPDRVPAGAAVVQPPVGRGWHAQAKAWYRALAESGQARFYEPSDWQQARVLAEMLSALLQAERPSSELFKAWLAGCHDLGVTEGSRRRMRIEVERDDQVDESDGESVAVMERYRRLAGG